MRVVVQRVSEAAVEVDGRVVSSIGRGLLLLSAFRADDDDDVLDWMARKCLELRIFEDDHGKMNRSLLEVDGSVLVVSQFTLYGDCRKGRRPDFTKSAQAEVALDLYRRFVEILGAYHTKVAEGIFGARMKVRLVNDGPVTLILEREVQARERI